MTKVVKQAICPQGFEADALQHRDSLNPDPRTASAPALTVGTAVRCNGHLGSIIEVCSGQLIGMAIVRLRSGDTCVALADLLPVTAGQTVRLTLGAAKAQLRPLGVAIERDGDEYRVNFKGGREATAYYTNDLDDALGTGRAMAEHGKR